MPLPCRWFQGHFYQVSSEGEMNENHERHLLTSFRYIDNLLSEAEHILANAGSASPFAEYTQDSTPVQRKVLHDYIDRVRQAMNRALADLHLPPSSPVCGAMWAAGGRLTFSQIAVTEIEPQHMRGYGALTDGDVKAINGVVAELNATLERLIAHWNRSSEADLQARLARLEATNHEARLLRELERVVTTHGLIEFRGALELLLERLENPVFEIGIFGRVSSGKSSLLNYLLGSAVLPVGVTPVTAFPTRVRYGAQSRAVVAFAESRPQAIELTRLAEFVTEQQNPGNTKHVVRASVEVPSSRLREGVAFVDTPGLGSLATAGAEETMAYLPRCDLGIVLIDAGSTITHEDLTIVQALYQSGSQAMVLVSKADLLGPAEYQQTSDYVERQLATQVNLKLRAHPVSVLGQSCGLCDEWLEKELMPLIESHRGQAAVAMKRKIGVLREAVLRVLQARLDSHGEPGRPASHLRDQEAITALRKADACLDTAQRSSEQILDGLSTLSDDILNVAAMGLAANWTSTGATDERKQFSDVVHRVLTGQVLKMVDTLSLARQELFTTLKLAHEVVLGADGSPEALPAPAEAPIPNLAPLTQGLVLSHPLLLSKLGKRLTRRHIRQQLETEVESAMTELLSRYRRQLREWFQKSVVELRENFAGRAGIYRAQLEGRSSSAEAAVGRTDLEGDLRSLQNW
jgi:GTP-binding protein EngB required for normal cell division